MTTNIGVRSKLPKITAPRRSEAKPRRVLFVTDFYLQDVLAGVVDHAREAGWELDANMRFHGLLPPLVEPCDGILATVTSERVRDWLAGRTNCPIVRMISTEFDLPYPAIEPDYAAAGRAGARHMLELGHIHYAFYSTFDLADVRAAREAFEAELAAAGRRAYRLDFLAANPARDPFQVGSEERHSWLVNELKRLPKPLAIMSDDDRRALGLLTACDLAGLRVPEDVAVLGCDNHFVEQGMARIPLSSVDMNFRGVGREAAALLGRLMRGGKPVAPVVKVPPAGVVARRSTATFVTESHGITAAVLYLREHFREPLRVARLARAAGMSERGFELEFKRRVGHTAREELQRARVACVARLLRDTNLKLDAIAVESGFSSASKLCKAFASVLGQNPTAWRQRGNGEP